jgi:hypothetical protein
MGFPSPCGGEGEKRLGERRREDGVVERLQARTGIEEKTMALSKIERVQELARLVGIPIADEDIAEVADRFESLMHELESLNQLDLSAVQPVTIFPEET